MISFLFLLVATFVTVYNFKNTRAEETDAVVSTSQVVKLLVRGMAILFFVQMAYQVAK